MKHYLKKSITILELLVALSLLTVMVLGFSSMDMFGRYHVLTSDKRAQVH